MKTLSVLFAFFMAFVMAAPTALQAQDKYFTKDGTISFFSATSMEDIEAANNKVTSVMEKSTGKIEFAVLMKGFTFEKALMQEHFNENYVESDKFPKSTFKGTITDIANVNFAKDGVYNVTVSGDLTLHGVTKPVTAKGTIEVKGDNLLAKSTFKILLSDHGIAIPAVVKDNISKSIEIRVSMPYKPLVK